MNPIEQTRTPQTLSTLQEAINQLTSERDRLDLTPLVQLEARIQQLAPRAVVDPAIRAELTLAIDAKIVIARNHERAAEIDKELRKLANEKANLTAIERTHRADEASKRLSLLNDRYQMLALECIRAWRDCQRQQRSNQSVPGANTGIPRGPSFAMWATDPNGVFSFEDELLQGVTRIERANTLEAA